MHLENQNAERENFENLSPKVSGEHESNKNSDLQSQKHKRDFDEGRIKTRKTVHDFLYFIEAVNNRCLKSQFRAN